MGFLDTIKSLFGGAATSAAEQAVQFQQNEQQLGGQQETRGSAPQSNERLCNVEDCPCDGTGRADTAGFDWDGDEDSFFYARNQMESEGLGGGTDQSRAEIMARYGIRDRSHWQNVKSGVYHHLSQKYGSFEEVSQREFNYGSGAAMRMQQGNVAAAAASGALAPVEGVSLEKWAAINAAIVQGSGLDDLLKGNGIDRARWDRARGEWEARMSSDTTFAVATVYGAAFQAASNSKFSALAKEANAARAANVELTSQPPMSVYDYFVLLYEQAYASKEGTDPQAALKQLGLSIVDWVDLSTFMGYFMHRTVMRDPKKFEADTKAAEAKVQANHPAVNAADVDIQF